MLKAIETVYNGYRFRSRTEARWAVFFDTLDIVYEYEKEGYNLGEAGWYLPDFWLPKQQCWIEVKGDTPTEEERNKAKALARDGKRPVWILIGLSDYKPELDKLYTEYRINAEMYRFEALPEWYADMALSDPDEYGGIAKVKRAIQDGGIIWQMTSDSGLQPFTEAAGEADMHILSCTDEQYIAAYSAARQARFEHKTA